MRTSDSSDTSDKPARTERLPHVDPGYALVRAIAPNAAMLVHNAVMDMLRVPPLSGGPRS